MVQITVNSDASPYALLETQLVQRFGLDEAVVVPSFDDEPRQRGAVARGAAGYLQRVLRDGMTVTIGLSRTLALMPDYIVAPSARRRDVRAARRRSQPHLARGQRARVDRAPRAALRRPRRAPPRPGGDGQPRRRARPAARAGDLAGAARRRRRPTSRWSGSAACRPRASTCSRPATSRASELAELRAAGAVGDIGARFFDRHGRPVAHELNDRLIGLTLEEIGRIGVRVAAAAGPEKHTALARGAAGPARDGAGHRRGDGAAAARRLTAAACGAGGLSSAGRAPRRSAAPSVRGASASSGGGLAGGASGASTLVPVRR